MTHGCISCMLHRKAWNILPSYGAFALGPIMVVLWVIKQTNRHLNQGVSLSPYLHISLSLSSCPPVGLLLVLPSSGKSPTHPPVCPLHPQSSGRPPTRPPVLWQASYSSSRPLAGLLLVLQSSGRAPTRPLASFSLASHPPVVPLLVLPSSGRLPLPQWVTYSSYLSPSSSNKTYMYVCIPMVLQLRNMYMPLYHFVCTYVGVFILIATGFLTLCMYYICICVLQIHCFKCGV
jgi:hypothetical protein